MISKNKKVALGFAALFGLMAVTLLANRSFEKTAVTMSSEGHSSLSRMRLPASQIYLQLRSGTIALEHKLAETLAEVKDRSLASIGRPADAIESLRFGILEGKYALTMAGDKITEIAFVNNPESEGRPATIGDRVEFLKKYGYLIDGVSQPTRVSIDIQGTKIIETYRIKSSLPDTDTVVKFVLDDMDRLFEMQTRKVSALKIF